MGQRKSTTTQVPFSEWPVSVLSHDVWAPNETVNLNAFARVRERGEMGNLAKSAIRALDIIELLAQSGKPLRAIEIASALGISPSSTHQLLKTMMDAAYLIFDPFSKRYHVSIRAANAGGALATAYFGAGAIERLVEATHRSLDMVITISASQGSFMQIIDMYEPASPDARAPSGGRELRQGGIGVRVPLFGSCTGAAWLATQGDETVLAAARLCRRALGGQAADSDHILDIVRRIREQGYAFGGVTADDRRRAIALSLPPSRDGIILVMSVSAPAEEAEARRDEIAGILRDNIAATLIPGR